MATSSDPPARTIRCDLPEDLWLALQERIRRTGEGLEQAVVACLSEALDAPRHSIFQVSTSGALVKGVYAGATRIGDVKKHGDMGLGTFVGLDGEGLMLDGRCYRAGPDGTVAEVGDDVQTPFWVTARFRADDTRTLADVSSWRDLEARLAALRPSDNLLAAVVAKGRFEIVRARVACKADSGTSLVDATSHQAEFAWRDVEGTLLGFWTPDYART
ncbi:MAG: acetolactate decarboxylase, partial [Alphaproteobacteria bacterium]